MIPRALGLLAAVAAAAAPLWAREPSRSHGPVPPRMMLDASALLSTQYRVEPNVVYLTAGNWNGKLDLYLPRHASGPSPVLVNFHGGGWVTGDKDEIALDVLPYLAMGFAVVNADYRIARFALAPAAVEDCRCVLRWVVRHATQYGLDTRRLVLAGSSAGAHLALMTALAPASAGFDRLCPGDEELRVAAVINYFGITDVAELLAPQHRRDFAYGWLGEGPNREQLAHRVSPLTYVTDGMPPVAVLSVHGDADPVVPYQQAVRLHNALDRVGAPNRLFTVKGGRHGDFNGDEVLAVTRAVSEFLGRQGIINQVPVAAPAPSPARSSSDASSPARL